MTAAGPTIRNGSVLLRDGKIAAVGTTVSAPPDADVIDGRGKFLTPGVIDDHSHLGVYAAPGGDALSDGNELTNPVTANVWAEHSVWPQDPQFPRALASGVTTVQILPGSGNLIGGRSVVLKVVPSASVQGMKWIVADAGNAARTAALCTNWPECAISWHSGQFEGSSLIGYLSRDVIAVALVPIVEATLPFTTLASETV